MKNLFLELFWPATAGNVAWSFFSVAVNENWCDSGVPARLLVLFFLAWYLAINWNRLRSIDHDNVKPMYWFADAFHLTTIIVFAIAAQQKDITWLIYSLELIFIVSIIGHLIGAWVKADKQPHWNVRLWLAGANAFGLFIIIARPVLEIQYPSILPVSLASTLIAWYVVRWCILPNSPDQ